MTSSPHLRQHCGTAYNLSDVKNTILKSFNCIFNFQHSKQCIVKISSAIAAPPSHRSFSVSYYFPLINSKYSPCVSDILCLHVLLLNCPHATVFHGVQTGRLMHTLSSEACLSPAPSSRCLSLNYLMNTSIGVHHT